MMLSMKAGFLWFMCGRLGIFPLTLARQQGMWSNVPDDIAVLEHTTARFNWLHIIRGNVHILWEHIGREGHREEVLAYARGHVDNSTLNYRRQRADYDIFPGSATMTLQNVSAYDEGTYEVSIASSAAGSIEDRSSVKLNVIPASNITLRVIIDGEIFRMSVAENGTNVTLPEGQVVFSTNPSITVEVGEFVPTPLSIVTKYDVKENPNHEPLEPKVHSCDHCRKLLFSWFNDIYIKVTFNIQNAETIHIKKKIRNQVPWKSVPGNVTVLVNTSAAFNWIHNIPGPVDITWYYRKNDTQPAQKIMNNIDGVITTFPGQMSSRIRYVPDDRSAAVRLENVVPSDEGFYEAVVVDQGASSLHNLSNVAKLKPIEESSLEYDIRIDEDEYHLSFVKNGLDVTLPDVVVFVPVKHTVQVKTKKSNFVDDMISVTDNVDEQEKNCRHTHKCASSFAFNSILAKDEVRNISIFLNFGVQNLRNISLHYTLHLNSSRDQNNSKEHCRDKNIIIGVFVACTIILATTLVAILVVCRKELGIVRRVRALQGQKHYHRCVCCMHSHTCNYSGSYSRCMSERTRHSKKSKEKKDASGNMTSDVNGKDDAHLNSNEDTKAAEGAKTETSTK